MTGYITRWFTRPQMVTHPTIDHKSLTLTYTLPSHLVVWREIMYTVVASLSCSES